MGISGASSSGSGRLLVWKERQVRFLYALIRNGCVAIDKIGHQILSKKGFIMKHRLRSLVAALGMLSFFSTLVFLPNTAFAATEPAQSPKAVSPNYQVCDTGWVYDNITINPDLFAQVGPTQSDYNGTGSNATATFTSSVSGTVSLSVNTTATVNANVIVGSASAAVGVTLSTSLTTSIGNNFAITVPPYKTGNGAYGVREKSTTGHYYYRNQNCSIGSDDGYITAKSPWTFGWNAWIS